MVLIVFLCLVVEWMHQWGLSLYDRHRCVNCILFVSSFEKGVKLRSCFQSVHYETYRQLFPLTIVIKAKKYFTYVELLSNFLH